MNCRWIFQWYGFKDNRLIRACGVIKPDDASGREDLMELVAETAKNACGD